MKELASDVVEYFRNHRPWKNVGNGEEILESDADQMLFQKAYQLAYEMDPLMQFDSRTSKTSNTDNDTEIDEYLDAEYEFERDTESST